MKQLPLWWLLLLWPAGLCEEHAGEQAKEREQRRRLERLARHLEVVEHEPELLDEQGKTPLLQIGKLKLRHVLTVNREKPWLIGHAQFSEEYHERRRLQESADGDDAEGTLRLGSRRLDGIQTEHLQQVAATPFIFTIPRDRIRLFAALNAAAAPEAAWTNASLNYWQAGGKVHQDPGAMLYTPNRTTIDNLTLTGSGWSRLHTGGWNSDTMGGNFTGTADAAANTIGNAYRDGQALLGVRQSVRDTANQQSPGWNDDFLGVRTGDCADGTQQDPRCWTDPGVAISVYEEPQNKVVVFHNDWSINWNEYILWQHRAWIIDNVETQVKNQWTIDARQVLTPDMVENKGEQYDENQERCAFKDQKNKYFADVGTFWKVLGLEETELVTEGYWSLVKRILRVVMPAARDMIAEKAINVYFTGSGFGGTWAALSSMFMKKVDDVKYSTFVIAGGGFECFARRLPMDMNPWEDHDQIRIYAHVMDVYARMDFVSGYTCLYGFYNMTEGSDIHSFCRGMVGFTGPQLLYRGEPVGEYLDERANPDEVAPQRRKVHEARKMFDACHYFTHSPWYAAMLFVDPNVLMRDGTTDGGCKAEASIPQVDPLGRCPTASRVEADCSAIEEVVVPFPWIACAVVAVGMAAFFCLVGVCLQMFLKLIDNKMWVFAEDDRAGKSLVGIIWALFLSVVCVCKKHKNRKKKKRKGCKAQLARERANQAKLKKYEKSVLERAPKSKSKNLEDEDAGEMRGKQAWEAVKSKLNAITLIHDSANTITQAAFIVGNTTSAVAQPLKEAQDAQSSEGEMHEDEPMEGSDEERKRAKKARRREREERRREKEDKKIRKEEEKERRRKEEKSGEATRKEVLPAADAMSAARAAASMSPRGPPSFSPSPAQPSFSSSPAQAELPKSAASPSTDFTPLISGDAEAKLPLKDAMEVPTSSASKLSVDAAETRNNAKSKWGSPRPGARPASSPRASPEANPSGPEVSSGAASSNRRSRSGSIVSTRSTASRRSVSGRGKKKPGKSASSRSMPDSSSDQPAVSSPSPDAVGQAPGQSSATS